MDDDEQGDVLVNDTELDWVETHFVQLRAMYGGEWIAVSGRVVIAHAVNPADLRSLLQALDTNTPFIKRIPAIDEVSRPFPL